MGCHRKADIQEVGCHRKDDTSTPPTWRNHTVDQREAVNMQASILYQHDSSAPSEKTCPIHLTNCLHTVEPLLDMRTRHHFTPKEAISYTKGDTFDSAAWTLLISIRMGATHRNISPSPKRNGEPVRFLEGTALAFGNSGGLCTVRGNSLRTSQSLYVKKLCPGSQACVHTKCGTATKTADHFLTTYSFPQKNYTYARTKKHAHAQEQQEHATKCPKISFPIL